MKTILKYFFTYLKDLNFIVVVLFIKIQYFNMINQSFFYRNLFISTFYLFPFIRSFNSYSAGPIYLRKAPILCNQENFLTDQKKLYAILALHILDIACRIVS